MVTINGLLLNNLQLSATGTLNKNLKEHCVPLFLTEGTLTIFFLLFIFFNVLYDVPSSLYICRMILMMPSHTAIRLLPLELRKPFSFRKAVIQPWITTQTLVSWHW